MTRLKVLFAGLLALVVVAPALAQREAPYLVHAVLFKKNITGARSKWELFIRTDNTVTVNDKPDKPLSQEDFDNLKKLINETDFATIMKTKSTEGYPSSKGGMDYEYFARGDKGRFMIANFMHVIDPELPFIKEMDRITKLYKPTFGRLVEGDGGGRGGRGGGDR